MFHHAQHFTLLSFNQSHFVFLISTPSGEKVAKKKEKKRRNGDKAESFRFTMSKWKYWEYYIRSAVSRECFSSSTCAQCFSNLRRLAEGTSLFRFHLLTSKSRRGTFQKAPLHKIPSNSAGLRKCMYGNAKWHCGIKKKFKFPHRWCSMRLSTQADFLKDTWTLWDISNRSHSVCGF